MKLQNAAGPTGWTGERPAQSIRDGGGCAFVDPGGYADQELDGPDDLEPTALPGIYKVEFTIVGRPWSLPDDGDAIHDIELYVSLFDLQDVTTWLWGASDVPAGITFNDATPAKDQLGVDEEEPKPWFPPQLGGNR